MLEIKQYERRGNEQVATDQNQNSIIRMKSFGHCFETLRTKAENVARLSDIENESQFVSKIYSLSL